MSISYKNTILKIIKHFIHLILSHAFPRICVLCHQISDQAVDLCVACEKQLPFINSSHDKNDYGTDLKKSLSYDKVIALFQYQFPITQMISRLKFHQDLTMSSVLGYLLVKYINWSDKPDCIIPVPLHIKRMRTRGFNQSLEIVRCLSRQLKIPINNKLVKRIRHTLPQTQLSAKKRKKNIRGAFKAVGPVHNIQHVMIFDDVITTGSTVLELAKTLKKVRVKKITILCCAKTHYSQ
jgi:ComF family protein